MKINLSALTAIYLHEMDRFRRTLTQSLLSPVLTTSLYFIVFGSVIGGYVEKIDGISYGSYIVPGLLMLTLLTQSISNTSFGIFFPKFNGTIYEKGDVVQNRFGGDSIELNNVELSMYDFIIGSTMVLEMAGGYKHTDVEELRKGLDWFRKNNAKAYMVLLD